MAETWLHFDWGCSKRGKIKRNWGKLVLKVREGDIFYTSEGHCKIFQGLVDAKQYYYDLTTVSDYKK